MLGKALTALLTLLVAAALAACGGGDGEETGTSARAGEGDAAPQTSEDVRRRADQVEEERREDGGQEGGGQGTGGGQKPAQPDEPPAPAASHQDSGGGAGQFRRKGGDNSIQEFGQEAGGSELDRAGAVLHAYLDARADRRWEDACSYLSAEAVAGVEQFASALPPDKGIEGCADVLGALSGGTSAKALREAAQADVGSLRMEGGRGFLLYHGAGGVDFAIPVAEEGGEWKLAAPEATPLP